MSARASAWYAWVSTIVGVFFVTFSLARPCGRTRLPCLVQSQLLKSRQEKLRSASEEWVFFLVLHIVAIA